MKHPGQSRTEEGEEISLGLKLPRPFLEEQGQPGDSLKHGLWLLGGELPELCSEDHFPLATRALFLSSLGQCGAISLLC